MPIMINSNKELSMRLKRVSDGYLMMSKIVECDELWSDDMFTRIYGKSSSWLQDKDSAYLSLINHILNDVKKSQEEE